MGLPFGNNFRHFLGTIFASFFRPPKNIKKREVSSAPSSLSVTLSPPSSDSSPLVNPLRVLPPRHRTHWASQSFPEQQTSVLSQQKTSILSQQRTSRLALPALELAEFWPGTHGILRHYMASALPSGASPTTRSGQDDGSSTNSLK